MRPMEKKNLIVVMLYLSILYLIFVTVSTLLFFNKKSVKLLKHKLKIGGIIITLTSMLNSCDPLIKPEVSCYMPVVPNNILLDNFSYENSYTLTITDMENNIITGKITDRATQSTEFSFQVVDSSGNISQSENISPADGIFDTETEYIRFEIDPSLPSGTYTLNIYPTGCEDITEDSYYLDSYGLIIDLTE